ncbi:MAG TPA: MATE family efflux transporter [Candidatus Avoscillospira stercoripullorum]|uniref:Multidrug export protein MepA n=1 Tax=Candidatus Avoscillospira stercoripullorum TaxID=2840709 RepID=A0A9D1D7D8_9FIRM|nr:MATE family efflux transporter [Candidatus Avoscillospira stercoripullorum]
MASAPVTPLLLRLAIPTILAQLVNLLYNIVDRIYIGHMPVVGDIALTGVGLCFPVIYLLSAFAALLGQGGAPRAAIAMGRGDNDEAERILGTCFTSLIVTALLLTAAFQLWGEELLWLFGASEDTIGYALPYMRVYAAGSLFVMLALGMNLFITTQGYTTFSMITVVIGAVLNIVLDPVFIYAFDMGVAGAAWATILSQAVSAAFAVAFFFGKRTKLRLKKAYLLPKPRILGPVLALGFAPFVMQATEALVNVAFNSSLQSYGGDIPVGCMTVSSTIMQMFWLPSQGIGQGAQPIISYNFGAGNIERVRKAFMTMLVVSIIFIGAGWLAVMLFPGFFIRIFNDSPALVEMGSWTLRVYLAAFFLMALQMSIQQVFVSVGRAKSAVVVASVRKLVLLVPLIYILPHFFEDKVFAVFLAEPVSDFFSVLTATILFLATMRGMLWGKKKERSQKA